MEDAPEPQRRLQWPGQRHALGDEPEEVRDPGGQWLPESEQQAGFPADGVTFDTLFRDERRWAPQHGKHGRSDSALPGAFLFPEPSARPHRRAPEGDEAAAQGDEAAARSGGHSLVREIVETLMLAILVFLAVRASVQHYRVEGHSMDPTLEDGEFLLVNSLLYSKVDIQQVADWVPFWDPGDPAERHVFHGPRRGDIVILHPRQRAGRDLVKRVIGVPGDSLEIRGGVVIVNGRELIEPYVTEPWQGDLQLVHIEDGQYFVMGDNRDESFDSRSFGVVEEEDIVGKAMGSWWPRSSWGRAPNEAPKFGAER